MSAIDLTLNKGSIKRNKLLSILGNYSHRIQSIMERTVCETVNPYVSRNQLNRID